MRDLDGKLVNGYSTFNTVCVNGDGKRLHLSDITVYSNGDKTHYVKQSELDKIEPQLACHPVIKWLCQLGNGKGKVTRHFFMERLRNLLIHHHVEQMREESGITDSEWDEILSFTT